MHIGVVADDVAERPRLNGAPGIQLQSLLLQNSIGRMGKEESVSLHELLELGGDDTGEGRANKTVSISGLLGKTSTETIDLIHTGID